MTSIHSVPADNSDKPNLRPRRSGRVVISDRAVQAQIVLACGMLGVLVILAAIVAGGCRL